MFVSKKKFKEIQSELRELKREVYPERGEEHSEMGFMPMFSLWFGRATLVSRVEALEDKLESLIEYLGVEVNFKTKESGYKVSKKRVSKKKK